MAQARIVTEFPSPTRPARGSAADTAMPLLLLGPSVRMGRARDEMLVLTPSNRVTEPDDPFRRIAPAEPIDLSATTEIDRLAEAEQDGRDAAHLFSDLDPEIAALASDLLGGVEGIFSPLTIAEEPMAGPLLLTSAMRTEGKAAGKGPLLLGPEMRAPRAAEQRVDEAAIRRMLTEIVRQELAGAFGQRLARDVRDLVLRDMRDALVPRA